MSRGQDIGDHDVVVGGAANRDCPGGGARCGDRSAACRLNPLRDHRADGGRCAEPVCRPTEKLSRGPSGSPTLMHLPVADVDGRHAPAIDEYAVEAPVVDRHPAAVVAAQHQVCARNQRARNVHVGLRVASDHDVAVRCERSLRRIRPDGQKRIADRRDGGRCRWLRRTAQRFRRSAFGRWHFGCRDGAGSRSRAARTWSNSLLVSIQKRMCPKLRALDQRFALVRTTRAIDDLRLYRILLTTFFGGSNLADLATRRSTGPDNVGVTRKRQNVGSGKGRA